MLWPNNGESIFQMTVGEDPSLWSHPLVQIIGITAVVYAVTIGMGGRR